MHFFLLRPTMFVEDDVRLAWYARSIVGASSAKRCKYRTVQWKVALFVGYYGCTGKEAAVRVCDAMNSAGASSALFSTCSVVDRKTAERGVFQATVLNYGSGIASRGSVALFAQEAFGGSVGDVVCIRCELSIAREATFVVPKVGELNAHNIFVVGQRYHCP